MGANNIAITFVVFTSFSTIRMHAQIEPLFVVAIILAGFNAVAFLVLTYSKLGEVNQRSKEFHGSWKRETGYLTPETKCQMQKFIRSSRPLRIELGEFGYYSKPASIQILGKLVMYVVKFLMLTSNFGT